jgi:hypothetical protein
VPVAQPAGAAAGYGVDPSDQPAPTSGAPATEVSDRPAKTRKNAAQVHETAIWDGLIQVPVRPESGLRESLLYPLWGATGVALLVLTPPLLWITSVPLLTTIAAFSGQDSPFRIGALLILIPASLSFGVVFGYALLFLGGVAASSAMGETHHPRWPDWDLSSIFLGLGRWAWAGLIGGVVGGFPAVAYWMYCGDVDLFDGMILAELSAVGAVYALMGLLASILHESALAANPFTVVRAIKRVGWGYAQPCLAAGFAVVVAMTLLSASFEVENPALSAFLFWLFWLVSLYVAMVVLRVLGLFYHRHARELGWFRDRTGWGRQRWHESPGTTPRRPNRSA